MIEYSFEFTKLLYGIYTTPTSPIGDPGPGMPPFYPMGKGNGFCFLWYHQGSRIARSAKRDTYDEDAAG